MKKIYGSSVKNHISPQKLEKMKIAFLFSSVSIISAIFGGLVANYISTEIYTSSLFLISNHFETAFLECSDFMEYANIIARYSLSDIISLLIIFAVSFSMLNYLVTDIVIFYSGMKFGVSVVFLGGFSRASDLPYTVGKIRLFVFVVIELAILLLMLYYAYHAAMSSVSFRRTDASGRPNIKTRDILLFLLKTAACIGAMLILNTVYCCLLYILK